MRALSSLLALSLVGGCDKEPVATADSGSDDTKPAPAAKDRDALEFLCKAHAEHLADSTASAEVSFRYALNALHKNFPNGVAALNDHAADPVDVRNAAVRKAADEYELAARCAGLLASLESTVAGLEIAKLPHKPTERGAGFSVGSIPEDWRRTAKGLDKLATDGGIVLTSTVRDGIDAPAAWALLPVAQPVTDCDVHLETRGEELGYGKPKRTGAQDHCAGEFRFGRADQATLEVIRASGNNWELICQWPTGSPATKGPDVCREIGRHLTFDDTAAAPPPAQSQRRLGEPECTVTSEGLPAKIVQRIARSQRGVLQACAEKSADWATATGLEVQLSIDEGGSTTVTTTSTATAVTDCVNDVALKFPRPRGGPMSATCRFPVSGSN